MNASEENKRGANELKDEELEEISGGFRLFNCHCPKCNRSDTTTPGTLCISCASNGVKSYMVAD